MSVCMCAFTYSYSLHFPIALLFLEHFFACDCCTSRHCVWLRMLWHGAKCYTIFPIFASSLHFFILLLLLFCCFCCTFRYLPSMQYFSCECVSGKLCKYLLKHIIAEVQTPAKIFWWLVTKLRYMNVHIYIYIHIFSNITVCNIHTLYWLLHDSAIKTLFTMLLKWYCIIAFTKKFSIIVFVNKIHRNSRAINRNQNRPENRIDLYSRKLSLLYSARKVAIDVLKQELAIYKARNCCNHSENFIFTCRV